MSFKSILAGIGREIEKVVGVGAEVVSVATTTVEPFVSMLNPAAGAILGVVGKATAAVEATITGIQQGVVKKQTATQIITAELPNVQALISAFGSGFQIPQAELSTLVDASVAVNNAIAAFVAAVKPKTGTVPPPVVGTTTTTVVTPPPA